jgi:hypothetical protein
MLTKGTGMSTVTATRTRAGATPRDLAAGLGLAGHSAYIAPWILLVVGMHFVPLGRLFGSFDLVWAGFTLSAVAIAGTVTGLVSDVAPSAVTGAFGGLVCIACAAVCLRRALLRAGAGQSVRAE